MTKSKKIGLALILLLPAVLVVYAIASVVIAQIVATPNPADANLGLEVMRPDIRITVARLVRLFLGLLGLLGIFTIPFGIYFLARKEPVTDAAALALAQSEKYKNLTPEQIAFINKWSWGAFLGTGIWALGNKLYAWFFLGLIPFVNLYVWIKLSVDGRKMAWDKEGWTGFDQFKKRQKTMGWIIGVIFILSIIGQVTTAVDDYNRMKNMPGGYDSVDPQYKADSSILPPGAAYN